MPMIKLIKLNSFFYRVRLLNADNKLPNYYFILINATESSFITLESVQIVLFGILKYTRFNE